MSDANDQRATVDEATPDSDAQITQMVSDPAGYFLRSRQEAKREARRYVAKRLRAAKTA